MTRIRFMAIGFLAAVCCSALAQDVGLINPGHVMGNGGSSAGAPTDAPLTSVMNHGSVTGGDLGAGKLNLSNGLYVLGGAGNAGGAQWTGSASFGAYEYGQGTIDDWAAANKNGTIVCAIGTGAVSMGCAAMTISTPLGLVSGGTGGSTIANGSFGGFSAAIEMAGYGGL